MQARLDTVAIVELEHPLFSLNIKEYYFKGKMLLISLVTAIVCRT